MKGKLYIVATPIGNLDDITLRAINTLKQVDIIIAEDTRHSLKLLNHLEITKPLISYHRHNEEEKTDMILNKIEEGNNIALISDAGTPVISDPGEFIVKEALERNIDVVPIPGACAIITALMAAGVNTRSFTFYGFLSLNKKIRNKELEQIRSNRNTIILYEAPHKIINTLKDLENYVGDRKIVLDRELTKIHEEFIRGTIEEVREKITTPKGEYVIIIDENSDIDTNEENELNKLTLEEHFEYYKKIGLDKKDIIKKIAKDRNVPKNEIYQHFIN